MRECEVITEKQAWNKHNITYARIVNLQKRGWEFFV